ncbi:hypothetical protein [Streptomyces sp. NBC_00582]|uniref:hypothetical protein n=1 Tax=Streptomyces sp. NBC_00582 TaxID=2975783 RepID=UPI00106347AD|nr:hypothetical protein [Streptomyces sp. NBC_00582]WUB59393.1 hypothetical protein OG852_02745 [Streptomyces sp. NBC_00582]
MTEPYGIDDKITRQAVFGNGAGLAVLIVNAISRRITVLPRRGASGDSADPPALCGRLNGPTVAG